jgi:hypothetical protein
MSRKLSQNQKTFNKVARHLLRQGCKSKVGTVCAYRGINGLRCGIGALIPNRSYKKSMEGRIADDYMVGPILVQLGYDPNFCRSLQRVHDQYEPHEWRGELEGMARAYGLKMPIV